MQKRLFETEEPYLYCGEIEHYACATVLIVEALLINSASIS